MTTFLLVLIILGLGWIVALEVRFHSLKDIAAESRLLAQEAAADARKTFDRFEARAHQAKAAPKKKP